MTLLSAGASAETRSAGGQRAGENGVGEGAIWILPRCAVSSIPRERAGGGWNPRNSVLHLRHYRQTERHVQRDVGGYAVALATSMVQARRQGGRRILCASDLSAGSSATPISFTRRCWQAWRLLFERTADVPGLRGLVENCRNTG